MTSKIKFHHSSSYEISPNTTLSFMDVITTKKLQAEGKQKKYFAHFFNHSYIWVINSIDKHCCSISSMPGIVPDKRRVKPFLWLFSWCSE